MKQESNTIKRLYMEPAMTVVKLHHSAMLMQSEISASGGGKLDGWTDSGGDGWGGSGGSNMGGWTNSGGDAWGGSSGGSSMGGWTDNGGSAW